MGDIMANQKEMWDQIHARGGLEQYGVLPSDFAIKIEKNIARRAARLLELGCGEGGDAAYFAVLGHDVVATDFSKVVVERASRRFFNVDFRVTDIENLPFEDNSFDVVYANLSLHYFDDVLTRRVFGSIARLLSGGGQLAFRCKSIYSQSEKENATEIAPNIYDKGGHLRHLFSTDYVEDVTSGLFRLDRNEYTTGDAYGFESFFIETEATKV